MIEDEASVLLKPLLYHPIKDSLKIAIWIDFGEMLMDLEREAPGERKVAWKSNVAGAYQILPMHRHEASNTDWWQLSCRPLQHLWQVRHGWSLHLVWQPGSLDSQRNQEGETNMLAAWSCSRWKPGLSKPSVYNWVAEWAYAYKNVRVRWVSLWSPNNVN